MRNCPLVVRYHHLRLLSDSHVHAHVHSNDMGLLPITSCRQNLCYPLQAPLIRLVKRPMCHTVQIEDTDRPLTCSQGNNDFRARLAVASYG